MKADLCCQVMLLFKTEYCCSRTQEEFKDSREAGEASSEASGTRPAWLESYSILGLTDTVKFGKLTS